MEGDVIDRILDNWENGNITDARRWLQTLSHRQFLDMLTRMQPHPGDDFVEARDRVLRLLDSARQ